MSLRIPPDLKEAAKALTQTAFHEWGDTDDGPCRGVNPSSINEAIIYLAETCLGSALKHLEPDLKDLSAEYEGWQEIVQFFLNNPAADRALPANFMEGSPGRGLAEEWINQAQEQAEEHGDSDDLDGIPRKEAFSRLSATQRVLARLVAVKGALQKALARRVT